LEEWENQNRAQIIRKCQMPFATITEAVCNFFQYFIGPTKFDLGFDFTICKRSQRDSSIRKRLDIEGWSYVTPLTYSFIGHGFDTQYEDVPARNLYFMLRLSCSGIYQR